MLTRREMLKLTAGATVGEAVPANLLAAKEARRVVPDYAKPMFDLPGKVKDRVIIAKWHADSLPACPIF